MIVAKPWMEFACPDSHLRAANKRLQAVLNYSSFWLSAAPSAIPD